MRSPTGCRDVCFHVLRAYVLAPGHNKGVRRGHEADAAQHFEGLLLALLGLGLGHAVDVRYVLQRLHVQALYSMDVRLLELLEGSLVDAAGQQIVDEMMFGRRQFLVRALVLGLGRGVDAPGTGVAQSGEHGPPQELPWDLCGYSCGFLEACVDIQRSWAIGLGRAPPAGTEMIRMIGPEWNVDE